MTTDPAAPLRLIIDANTYLGETPIWSSDEQALYWINCEDDPMLSRWDAATGERRDWAMPERIGGFVLKEGGGALIVLSHGLHDLDLATGALALRTPSPLPDHISLHECRCDRDGRLWVGAINHRLRETPQLPGGGMLFRLEGDELVAEVDEINCANGLAFSPDGTRLYLSDSPTAAIECWSLDRTTGALSDRRTFAEIAEGDGFVDGATVDADGGYWATLVYGSAIRRYLPDGSVDRHIELPFANPTNAAFGGPGLRTLFVTTTQMIARSGNPNLGQAMLGGVYTMDVGLAGLAEPRLKR